MNIISAYRHRVMRAFRRAGIDADRARGALVHGLRHTFATELANADVSVYAPDEAAWPRVHCDVTAVHHRRRKRNPHSRFANRLHGLLNKT